MNEKEQINNDNKNRIYSIESGQKDFLEKYINESLVKLKQLFQKEEILKFLYKNIEEGKYDFEQDNPDKNNPLTEEEINEKKDKLCRGLKEIFDSIKPEIYQKYNKRIATATIKIMEEMYSRKVHIVTDPLIRKVKIKKVNSDSEENKMKYNNLNIIKNVIQDTIYFSKFYIEELNNSNALLFQDLNQFYNDKSNIEIVNNVNGEDKKAKDDEFIQRVVNLKETKGKDFIINTKNYISQMINEQNNLDNKISELVKEFTDINEQKETFENYCNEENSIFRDINILKIIILISKIFLYNYIII